MWAEQAILISQRFNAYIIPLIRKDQPFTKLSLDKWGDKGLSADKLPSKDPDQILDWGRRFTAYGVVPADQFLIIDVDVKEKQHGLESLKFLMDKGLDVDTFTVKTPSGGLHLYYSHPNHYTPSQSVGDRIKFENTLHMQEWEALRSVRGGSGGIDTRYGWGYVVGPGSKFDDKEYVLINDKDLGRIPSTMCIGFPSTVQVTQPKLSTPQGVEKLEPNSVRENRNNHALDWTFRLSLRRYPDTVAQLMIREAVKAYDNHDGEAPTYDIMWDMYVRAKEKGSDIVAELLMDYVYLIKGCRVLNVHTGDIVKKEEFFGAYSGKAVPIETSSGVKMVNPVKIWETSSERLIVQDDVFDIGREHGIIEVPLQRGVALYYNRFLPPNDITFDMAEETPMGIEIAGACIRVIRNIVSSPYDLDWFRKWIGQMLFDPGNRPAWHWHIFSNARGIGKDTLASIITKLYGECNVARFGIEAFEDKSNVEFFNCGLGVMSDFAPVSGQGGKSKVLAQFKSLTGANTGRMRAMYMDGQQRVVSLRFLMLSNSYNDFPVDVDDRRLFKCESKGVTLDARTYALTHCFTDPKRVTKEMIEQYDLIFDDADLMYAHALLLDYFRTSGYEDMSSQFDCPVNDIKNENKATTEPKYLQDIRKAIDHQLYVFASDIVTRDSLALFLDHIKVTTSPDTVLRDLLDKGILHKMKRRTSNHSYRACTISLGYLMYEEDLVRITEQGTPILHTVYACRNISNWCAVDAKRKPLQELRKIIDYPNIKNGWSARTADMIKRNNVVPISS